jgi:hypothetical protein
MYRSSMELKRKTWIQPPKEFHWLSLSLQLLNTKLIRYLLSLSLEINCTVLNCCKSELVEMFSCSSPSYNLRADSETQCRNL